MNTRIRLLAVVMMTVAALTSGCSRMKKYQAQASASITQFHNALNAGQSDQIYQSSTAEFKKAVTPEQWNKLVAKVQAKLGKQVSSSDPGVFVNWTTNGTFVKANCSWKFAIVW